MFFNSKKKTIEAANQDLQLSVQDFSKSSFSRAIVTIEKYNLLYYVNQLLKLCSHKDQKDILVCTTCDREYILKYRNGFKLVKVKISS